MKKLQGKFPQSLKTMKRITNKPRLHGVYRIIRNPIIRLRNAKNRSQADIRTARF